MILQDLKHGAFADHFIGSGQVRDIIARGLAPMDGRESAMVVDLLS